MEQLLRFLRARLRASRWSSEAMIAARLGDLDHDPSQGVRHVVPSAMAIRPFSRRD